MFEQTKTKSLITSQFEWLANRAVTVSQSGEILMLSYKQAKTPDVSDVHEQSNENTSRAAAGGGQSWRQHGGSVVSTAASQQTRSWVWIQVCLSNIKRVEGSIPGWGRSCVEFVGSPHVCVGFPSTVKSCMVGKLGVVGPMWRRTQMQRLRTNPPLKLCNFVVAYSS